MTEILATIVKDLRRFFRDPLALIMWLGIPIGIGAIMVLVMGGGEGPAPRVHVLIADEDDSFGSRMLLNLFDNEQAEMLHAEKVDAEAGRQRLDRGEASALLVIPEGFMDAVLQEEPVELDLITNPAQRIAPAIVEELLSLLRDAVFYAHRLLGPQIRLIADGPPTGADLFSDDTMAGMSVTINQKMRRVQQYIDPPAIKLETATAQKAEAVQVEEEEAEAVPFTFYFLPGMLLMGLLFSAQGLSEDIWKERESGALRRVLTTPLGITRFLVGKTAAGAVVMAAIAFLALLAGVWYFDIPWTRFPLAWLWSIGIGILLFGLMLVLQVSASSHRGASVLGYLVVFPLMMLGGSMFPFEIMPNWMAAIGRFTPNGWALQQLKAILLGEAGPLPLLPAFALLLLVAACFYAVAGFRISRVFAGS